MRKKTFFILGLCLITGLQTACGNKPQSDNKPINQEGMQDLDSLLGSYTATPTYYADYGNTACLFELRVNDVLVDELRSPGSIGLTSATLNPYILRSGTNTVSVKLRPNPGTDKIHYDLYPYYEPFKLKITYVNFMLPPELQEEIEVFEMPPLKLNPRDGGIPSYEYEGEFEAVVPYTITGWSDCIDLREIPDIEQRVVEEFKRVRQMMIDRKFDELRQYYALKNNDASVVLYESQLDNEERWSEYVECLKKGATDGLQPIEEYRLEFDADGRSVTLRSNKKKGFPSAIVKIWESDKFLLSLLVLI